MQKIKKKKSKSNKLIIHGQNGDADYRSATHQQIDSVSSWNKQPHVLLTE
jgi:hypothetical protein